MSDQFSLEGDLLRLWRTLRRFLFLPALVLFLLLGGSHTSVPSADAATGASSTVSFAAGNRQVDYQATCTSPPSSSWLYYRQIRYKLYVGTTLAFDHTVPFSPYNQYYSTGPSTYTHGSDFVFGTYLRLETTCQTAIDTGGGSWVNYNDYSNNTGNTYYYGGVVPWIENTGGGALKVHCNYNTGPEDTPNDVWIVYVELLRNNNSYSPPKTSGALAYTPATNDDTNFDVNLDSSVWEEGDTLTAKCELYYDNTSISPVLKHSITSGYWP